MATPPPFFIFLLTLTTVTATTTTTNLYHSPKTTFSNYNNMLTSFKIFIYPPSPPPLFTTKQESHFYKSLLNSHFLTQDPNQAHLFFLPFPSPTSTRSLARLIKTIRLNFPFWNRTLGADHFFLSAAGIDPSSDRNVVELKKNSIQISSFPTSSGLFIPHKDITLPPVHSFPTTPSVNSDNSVKFLGYMKLTERITNSLIDEINDHPEFTVEYNPVVRFMKKSKFCLFVYGYEMTWMVEAMALRCVPVVITDRPIQDLPLMDVINWSEIAVFVSSNGGVKEMKRVLDGIGGNEYEKMVESGVVAAQHLRWNEDAEAYDAFYMIVYQLWLRRHTIRYARWVE